MTQPYDDDDQYVDGDDDGDDTGQGQFVQLSRSQIRAMERDAKQARKAADEAAALRKELAFARVGSDFNERQQRALLASIEGDVTPDSIRVAAEELGFLQPAAPPEDSAAAQRIAAASQGSPSEADEDPLARLYRADAEGGRDAVLAELQRTGHTIVNAG